MEDQLISFETAKLAKEKGFKASTYTAYIDGKFHENEDEPNGYDGWDPAKEEDWNGNAVYTKDGSFCFGCQGNPNYFEACAVTTQSLLKTWLRKEHSIDVNVKRDYDGWCYSITEFSQGNKFIKGGSSEMPDYDIELEEGLFEALKLITK